MHAALERQMGPVVVLVQGFEQRQHRLARKLRALQRIKPNAVAGKAQIQLQRLPQRVFQQQILHGSAARGARHPFVAVVRNKRRCGHNMAVGFHKEQINNATDINC